MPGCLFIKFNNSFVSPDPEPPIISICMANQEFTVNLNYLNAVPGLFCFYLHNHQN